MPAVDLFVEAILLWITFFILTMGVMIRMTFFFYGVMKRGKHRDRNKPRPGILIIQSLIPFYKGTLKRPFYAGIRYIFHACIIIVPIWLTGHITLWEESRFEWSWNSIPDELADFLTLAVIGLSIFFFLRRWFNFDRDSMYQKSSFFLTGIVGLTFLSGYLLSHEILSQSIFLGDHLRIIHVLFGEAMILSAAFLFCVTTFSAKRCTGCASCVLGCPSGALESQDDRDRRYLYYAPDQCIHCGGCVHTCPEDAAELAHKIDLKWFFRLSHRHVLHSVELEACEGCGGLYVPAPQLNKIGKTILDPFIQLCSACKGKEMVRNL